MNLEQSKANNGQERILVIIGPTGSGKTGLAIDAALELARLRGVDVAAEVISADSRAIYKGMDIGTAKPTREEMQGVPHWGIDLVEPDERFTVVDFCDFRIWPVFNIADIAIVLGVASMIYAILYKEKETDE